jgi:hypothetical protein
MTSQKTLGSINEGLKFGLFQSSVFRWKNSSLKFSRRGAKPAKENRRHLDQISPAQPFLTKE